MSQTSRDLQVDLQVLYRTTEQVVTYSLIRYTTRYPLEQQANWDGESTDNCGETNCVIYSRELNKLMGLCDHQL